VARCAHFSIALEQISHRGAELTLARSGLRNRTRVPRSTASCLTPAKSSGTANSMIKKTDGSGLDLAGSQRYVLFSKQAALVNWCLGGGSQTGFVLNSIPRQKRLCPSRALLCDCLRSSQVADPGKIRAPERGKPPAKPCRGLARADEANVQARIEQLRGIVAESAHRA